MKLFPVETCYVKQQPDTCRCVMLENNGVKHQPSHASVFSHITHIKSPGMVGEGSCVSVGGRARLTLFCMFLQAV